MPLADFNKDNPFVVIMRILSDELEKKTFEMTKTLIRTGIFISIFTILSAIFIKYGFILIPLFVMIMAYNIITWTDIIKKSELPSVNKIVYGDEYSAINVNNEKLFEIIGNMNIAKGELKYFTYKLYFDIPIVAGIIAILILVQIFS